ncbi:MAG: alanine dehydrogenase, partial [Desulfuromusa sp.]|nr:alanine dehydrogenase [Desulfuromusa sp.]
VDGIVHYCVANMPGAVPLTSTMALTNATLPYAVQIANQGWKQVARNDVGIREGFNVVDGVVCYKGVADAFGMDFVPVDELLKFEP